MKKTLLLFLISISFSFALHLNPSNECSLSSTVISNSDCIKFNSENSNRYFSGKYFFETSQDENLLTGNPSNAVHDFHETNNYLMIKHAFALSYNDMLHTANWVSWHLSASWKGNAKRCNCFSEDDELPENFYRVSTKDYTKTGFDRGHLCPSDDRDENEVDNAATFRMTNMIPQSPNLNRITWVALENYCRKLVEEGNELYIIAGGYGKGGTGSKGFTQIIGTGHVTVPAHCWKIIIVLPYGNNDLQRISSHTRVIAVDMPNTQTVKASPWFQYRTTIDEIEQKTGFDFLSNVPDFIEKHLESAMDDEIINN